MAEVDLSRVPAFYHGYIGKVPQNNLNEAFVYHEKALLSLLDTIAETKWDHRYAQGKWSIRETVQHIIDAERIFCYRALCFARGDKTELPGFDENAYAASSRADKRISQSLKEELRSVQQSSMLLFGSFDEEQLNASGVANKNSIYVKGIGFIIVGHALHHKSILEERYLK
ncbi:MAG: DinB family protein [Flavisolibacter sp.]